MAHECYISSEKKMADWQYYYCILILTTFSPLFYHFTHSRHSHHHMMTSGKEVTRILSVTLWDTWEVPGPTAAVVGMIEIAIRTETAIATTAIIGHRVTEEARQTRDLEFWVLSPVIVQSQNFQQIPCKCQVWWNYTFDQFLQCILLHCQLNSGTLSTCPCSPDLLWFVGNPRNIWCETCNNSTFSLVSLCFCLSTMKFPLKILWYLFPIFSGYFCSR